MYFLDFHKSKLGALAFLSGHKSPACKRCVKNGFAFSSLTEWSYWIFLSRKDFVDSLRGWLFYSCIGFFCTL